MNVNKYVPVFFKGMAMGAADVVPGVSGGTVAFITGIYLELLDSLKAINPKSALMLFKEGPKPFWQAINGNFLLSLLLGIAVSFLSLAHVISWLMVTYPLLLWSFFFGLVVASTIHMSKQLNVKCPVSIGCFIVGAGVAFFITSITPSQMEPSHLKVFAAGAVAICAMILPGISGSFILLLLGMYAFIIEAIKSFDLGIIAVFLVGCVTGLLCFVHLLSWLLHHYRSMALSLLTGFLLGSLNALWPWKHVLTFYESRKGLKPLAQENVLPSDYLSLTGNDPMLLACIVVAILGLMVVLGLERLSHSD